MSAYENFNEKIVKKGKDKKGNYYLIEATQTINCSCHPETCTHSKLGTITFKRYNNGNSLR